MMEQQALPLKYRPKEWSEFVGNEATVASLRSVLGREEGRPHTILLEGPSGCGKTTLARLVAKELECSEQDLFEMNISDLRGIDTARGIIQKARYAPLNGPVKIYILNECHQATKDFWNAMLDILEFAPAHVYFVLCTTEPEKVLPTIRGQRAQVFRVQPLIRNVVIKLVKDIVAREGLEPLSNKVCLEIANCAEGSPRKALAILDQIIDLPGEEQMLQAVVSSSIGEKSIADITTYLMSPGRKNWKEMSNLIKQLDVTPDKMEGLRAGLAKYFGSVLLNRQDDRIHDLMCLFAAENWYYSGREKLISALYVACKM
jgi:DNA polymerase III gamma/tau subunit